MENKKGYINPQIILVIAGILLGYTFGPQIGLDHTLGSLLGGILGFRMYFSCQIFPDFLINKFTIKTVEIT